MRHYLFCILCFIGVQQLNSQACDITPDTISFINSEITELSILFRNESYITVEATASNAENSALLITDSLGVILSVVQADESGCQNSYVLLTDLFVDKDQHNFYEISQISSDSSFTNLSAGQELTDFTGCFRLSNRLKVNDIELPNFALINTVAATLDSSHLNLFAGAATLNGFVVPTATRAIDVCMSDSLNLSFGTLGVVGDYNRWVVNTRDGIVLDILDEPVFNFNSYVLQTPPSQTLYELELFHVTASAQTEWLRIGENIKVDFCGSPPRNQTAKFLINFIECNNTCSDGFLNNGEVELDNCVVDTFLLCNIINKEDISCFGFNDGTAEVVIESGIGPFTYEWNNGDSTAVISDLPPGAYTVTITGREDITTTCNTVINQPDSLSVDIEYSFFQSCRASASVNGGLVPYSYEWSTGEQFITIANVDSLQSVTVTDDNGCQVSATISLEELSETCGNCSDGIMNGNETGIDCGGTCEACPVDSMNMNPIQLTKLARFVDENDNGFAEAGETIDYIFTVCNAGSVQLTQVSINDPLIAVQGGPIILAANDCNASSFSGSYTITESDVEAGSLMNQATVSAMLADSIMVSDLSDDPDISSDIDIEDDGEPDDPTITTILKITPCGLDATDTDMDGECDAIDEDDDNDGVVDTEDAFPLNSFETIDSDGDGFGDNADFDDDNDGVDDRDDAFPLDAGESIDTDGDGIGNNADTNDDGDSCMDAIDNDPLNPSIDCLIEISCESMVMSDDFLTFGGNIKTDIGLEIDSVLVNVTRFGDNSISLSDSAGYYASPTLPTGVNYLIRPEKEEEAFLGISTLDMLFVQRHILRIDTLSTPYKIIAADVSGNQEISIVDIIVMRRMILGIIDEWNEGLAWKFVDADFNFFDVVRPWPFPITKEIQQAELSRCDADFVAIKLGDVDNSYEGRQLTAVTRRTNNTYDLYYERSVTEDGEYQYRFYPSYAETVYGFQLGLSGINSDIRIKGEGIRIDDDQYVQDGNDFMMTWTNPTGLDTRTDEALFTIVADKDLSDLQLAKHLIRPEIYLSDHIETHELRLIERLSNNNLDVTIVPNPFSETTQIQFSLDKRQQVRLSIYTAEGKLMFDDKREFSAGDQAIQIPESTFNHKGIYVYSLLVNDKEVSGKLVKN